MNIELPVPSLAVLIGPSGAGKSTFAARHFLPTEVLSSDQCRAMVSDDISDQTATSEAFEILNAIASARLRRGRLTVADATSVQQRARRNLIELAKSRDCPAIAIVFNINERTCQERNEARTDRKTPRHTISRQRRELSRSLRGIRKEGFKKVYVLEGPEQADQSEIYRVPNRHNRVGLSGPFDIIGDVHGCRDELAQLLEKLGYRVNESGAYAHTEGRTAVFLGDLVDRGPDSPGVLETAMKMAGAGTALCLAGNHEYKLMRKMMGRNVTVSHGLAETLAQMEERTPEFRQETLEFLQGLDAHYVLDQGRLVVAHAGIKEEYQGRESERAFQFALYGETTGETDEWGLPERVDWAREYRGKASVVYGHSPVPDAQWFNNTINLDTGCVFGGALTALRYPEKEMISVPAIKVWRESPKPILPQRETRPNPHSLQLSDVAGSSIIETALTGPVRIQEENAAAALETVSRFTVDPRWLIYVPPTMSPCETAGQGELLEHPEQAFQYYRRQGVTKLVCQEKHMGSRAVVIAAKSAAAASARFGIETETPGICYTRTGRRFFHDRETEAAFLNRISEAAGAAGLWERLDTQWILLDCELMPWSLKGEGLVREQYAPAAAAARQSLTKAATLLEQAKSRGMPADNAAARNAARRDAAERMAAVYARYCWPVQGLEGVKLAPFHLLASEGQVHVNRSHQWHMETARKLAGADPELVSATSCRSVNLEDPGTEAEATGWWERLTADGGEGMVVKPENFIATGRNGLVQPAVKCRGPEYLRIIYGPEYNMPENIERLRRRNTGAKRSLALREFSLGIEGLHRFARREPLHRIHQCAFAVLALESEPVDPRL